MKKKYFLFGAAVSRAMQEEGIEAALVVAKQEMFDTFCWDENSTPHQLLNKFEGWNAYLDITEEDYEMFNSL